MSNLVEAKDIVNNPNYMLYRIDIDQAELHFLEVTQDTYRKSTYLDNRIQHTKERLVSIPIEEIIKAYENIPASHAPIQFIFHISFCCSTLLARALQSPGDTLVIREPWIFFQLSSVKTRMQATGEWNSQGPALIDLMLTLLNKTYDIKEHIVIKPSNLSNNLIDDVLDSLPESRAILLYTDLREYIISNLKKPDETKQKIPWLASEAAALVGYKESFPAIIPAQLPHLRAAAVFWHSQLLHFMHLLGRKPERLRVLRAEDLLANPGMILPSVSEWLQLDLDSGHFNNVVNGSIWHSHAKDPRYTYGMDVREHENRDIIQQHASEIEDTLNWAEPLLISRPVSMIEQYKIASS